MPNDENNMGELRNIASMLAESEAFRSVVGFNKEQWLYFLTEMEEDEQLQEFVLIVEEEQSMLEEIEKKKIRKLKINEVKLKQRIEKLTVEAEQLISKLESND